MSQKSVNNTRRINRKAKPSPIKETNHQLSGLRKGAAQANKKKMTVIILIKTKNRLANNLYLRGINCNLQHELH